MKPNSTKEKFIKIRKGILDKKDKLQTKTKLINL